MEDNKVKGYGCIEKVLEDPYDKVDHHGTIRYAVKLFDKQKELIVSNGGFMPLLQRLNETTEKWKEFSVVDFVDAKDWNTGLIILKGKFYLNPKCPWYEINSCWSKDLS